MTRKRNRTRPLGSLEDRLQKFAADKLQAASLLPPGPERDDLLKKVRQSESAINDNAILRFREAAAVK
ncbi:MAG TPA: hypothetical protein VG345_09960 [Bryobacteraceae bacterium]|nr:hypothetical protein [Bryobacteraceae bacterium]